MEKGKKWNKIVKISQQGGGANKLNNGIFILLFTFAFCYRLLFLVWMLFVLGLANKMAK